jgi:hypothetical protein
MTLSEAITAQLLNKRVTVVTTKDATITGTLKTVGDNFIDVHEKTGKSTIMPFSQIVSIEEL